MEREPVVAASASLYFQQTNSQDDYDESTWLYDEAGTAGAAYIQGGGPSVIKLCPKKYYIYSE
jgi:hypothetical protein